MFGMTLDCVRQQQLIPFSPKTYLLPRRRNRSFRETVAMRAVVQRVKSASVTVRQS